MIEAVKAGSWDRWSGWISQKGDLSKPLKEEGQLAMKSSREEHSGLGHQHKSSWSDNFNLEHTRSVCGPWRVGVNEQWGVRGEAGRITTYGGPDFYHVPGTEGGVVWANLH